MLRWARNGAAVGAGLVAAGLLVPAELGGYRPPHAFAAIVLDFAAMLTAIVVGALTGAALANLVHRRHTH